MVKTLLLSVVLTLALGVTVACGGQEWYEGGAPLANATLAEWRQADERDRLAAAALFAFHAFEVLDMAETLADAEAKSEIKTLIKLTKPHAEDMLTCLDGLIIDVPNEVDSRPVTSVANACVSLLNWPNP